MNFRIIEPTQQQEEAEYKLFKKYYKNRLDLTIQEIQTTLQIGPSKWRRFTRRLKEEEKIIRSPGTHKIVEYDETIRTRGRPKLSFKEFEELYLKFKELYENRLDLSKTMILEELNITNYTYHKLRHRYTCETGMIRHSNMYWTKLVKI